MNAKPMQPPWTVYPHLERGSIGWRMGHGEDYYDAFYRWFSDLTNDQREQFASLNPEPEAWVGFYKFIEDHPWNSS